MTKQSPGSFPADTVPTRPLPKIDEISSGFWEATARGELAIQRCGSCQKYQHPPRPVCPFCGSVDLAFSQVSGDATLYSWTLSQHKVLPGLDEVTPYLAILVELVEQETLLLASDLMGQDVDPATLKAGLPMHVEFIQTADEGTVLPEFRFVDARDVDGASS